MASYSSYKQITNARIVDGSIPGSAVQSGTFSNWCVKWIRGNPGNRTEGCCCNWSVPTGTKRITFELWGAGGTLLVEDIIIQKLFRLILVVHILYVLVEFTDVVQENV